MRLCVRVSARRAIKLRSEERHHARRRPDTRAGARATASKAGALRAKGGRAAGGDWGHGGDEGAYIVTLGRHAHPRRHAGIRVEDKQQQQAASQQQQRTVGARPALLSPAW